MALSKKVLIVFCALAITACGGKVDVIANQGIRAVINSPASPSDEPGPDIVPLPADEPGTTPDTVVPPVPGPDPDPAPDPAPDPDPVPAPDTPPPVVNAAPSVEVQFPVSGALTNGSRVTVKGSAVDPEGDRIASVMVAGEAATTSDDYAYWEASITLAPGVNEIVIATADENGSSDPTSKSIFLTSSPLLDQGVDTLLLDQERNRTLALSAAGNTLYSVDSVSGLVEVLSSNDDAASADVPFDAPVDMLIHGQAIYVLNEGDSSIVLVDPQTGARTLFSAQIQPAADALLVRPSAMTVDALGNRLLVSDVGNSSVVAVSLVDGERRVISSLTKPNANHPFSFPGDIVVDTSQPDRAFVANITELQTVSLDSGEREPFFVNSNFFAFKQMKMDAANDRLLMEEFGLYSGFIGVGLADGDVTVISSKTVPNQDYIFWRPEGLVVDSDNDRGLTFDKTSASLVAFDLTHGEKVAVDSSDHVPSAQAAFGSPQDMMLDAVNNKLFVIDSARNAIIAVDIASGQRSIVFQHTFGNALLGAPGAAALDTQNNALYVFDRDDHNILAIDLNDSSLSVLSSNAAPNADNPLTKVESIVVDAKNEQLLVLDSEALAVMAVSLDNGARTVLSNVNTPDAENGFNNPTSLSMDANNDRVFVVDNHQVAQMRVIAIDLATGKRTPVLQSDDDLGALTDIVIDSVNNVGYLTQNSPPAVQRVDLLTGEITPIIDTAPGGTSIGSALDIELRVEQSNQAFVLDGANRAITLIDLDDGEQVIFSR